MTRDDIIRMAREAGLPMQYRFVGGATHWDFDEPLERFAALAYSAGAAAEREECAKVADGFIGADPIAAAIRARGQE